MPEPLSLEILLHEQPIGSLSLLEGDRSILSFSAPKNLNKVAHAIFRHFALR